MAQRDQVSERIRGLLSERAEDVCGNGRGVSEPERQVLHVDLRQPRHVALLLRGRPLLPLHVHPDDRRLQQGETS